mgnify:CR=1 FL=1
MDLIGENDDASQSDAGVDNDDGEGEEEDEIATQNTDEGRVEHLHLPTCSHVSFIHSTYMVSTHHILTCLTSPSLTSVSTH